jgi:hypothetical protein
VVCPFWFRLRRIKEGRMFNNEFPAPIEYVRPG